MGYDYNALYGEHSNALGDTNPHIAAFFECLGKQRQKVLDVGCGQGRDALFVARLGHSVVGVDLATNGIADLEKAAKAESLDVTGIVADITAFDPPDSFDIIVVDRTLHMLDQVPRHAVLANLLDHTKANGWALIIDEPSNMDGFMDVIDHHPCEWSIKTQSKELVFIQRS